MRILLVAFAIIISIAQPVNFAPTISASQNSMTIEHKDLENIDVLRAQLETTKRFQADILSTVHWSLGVLVAISIILVGFGWYANFRVYERDKQSLREEVHSQMKLGLDKLNLAVESKQSESLKLISEQITKETQEAHSSLRDHIEKNKINSERMLGAVVSDIKHLKIKLFKIERDHWIEKKVIHNALARSISILELAMSVRDFHTISEALDMVHNDLVEIHKDRSIPDAIDITELTELLIKLDPKHKVIVDSIQAIMRQLRGDIDKKAST